MKKFRILIIVISIAMLGISLFLFQPKTAKANYCDHCYRTLSNWPGSCCNCMCDYWNYAGEDLCNPEEPE